MTSSPVHDSASLLSALLSTIEQRIVPLTAAGVAAGNKVFGAAILRKADPAGPALAAATNNEQASPLLHGEIHCIQQFFGCSVSPSSSSPAASTTAATKDCLFIATHEPCSLCLSGIAWAGFDNVYYLFTYEDSRDRFAIPYDIRILEAIFQVRGEGESGEALARRPLYNRRNAFFTATSFAELVADVADPDERAHWAREVERVKGLYDGLSRTYQAAKERGLETTSVWK